jgi:hypothetical protein
MNEPNASSAKGRATRARLLACLLTVALAASAAAAPAALGAPETPVLTGTSPASPSTELRPRILGEAEEGIIVSTVGMPRAFGGGVSRATKNPHYLITIYADDPTCENSGAVVANGEAVTLEGEGIQVEQDVALDAVTQFYATQTDPEAAETSACSEGISYRQITTPPVAPEFTATSPASPANVNTPSLIGVAPAESTVLIYADPTCSGTALASGSAASFEGGGIEVSVADNSTTVFYAEASLAGLTSACSSSSIEYQEVTPVEEPPVEEPPGGEGEGPKESGPNPPGRPDPPKLRTSPEGTANDNTPKVMGKAPGATRVEVYEGAGCRGQAVATGSVAQFGAGLSIEVADNSTVALYGVSIDGGGDRSACSADPALYVEDSIAPHARFTSGPGPKTRRRTVRFTFIDTTGDGSTSFRCKIDRRRWRSCHSPLRLRHLGHRRHTIRLRGVDAAGNVQRPVVKRRFKTIRRR